MTRNQSVIVAVLVGASVAALASLAPNAATHPPAQAQEGALAQGELVTELGIVCSAENGGGCRETLEADLAKRKPEGPVPRTPWDRKPDFNGVYYPQVAIARPSAPLGSMYRPEILASREQLQKRFPGDTPEQHCAPRSPVQAGMSPPHPVQIVQAPGVFVLIDEQFGHYRIIPTDGRPHNPTKKPSFQGDSVGRWEGDTLVVEVKNFNGFPWLDRNVPPPTVTSTALRVVERWTRPDAFTFEYQAVIEDPKSLTGPWTGPKLRRSRLPYDMIHESYCLEELASGDLIGS